jgi:S1-C subfamily serine protease
VVGVAAWRAIGSDVFGTRADGSTEHIRRRDDYVDPNMSESAYTRREALELGSTAVLAGLAGCSGVPRDDPAVSSGTTAAAGSAGSGGDSGAENAYTRAYRETIGSVVRVRTDDGSGTRFVFDESHVVTNAHVVGRASRSGATWWWPSTARTS